MRTLGAFRAPYIPGHTAPVEMRKTLPNTSIKTKTYQHA